MLCGGGKQMYLCMNVYEYVWISYYVFVMYVAVYRVYIECMKGVYTMYIAWFINPRCSWKDKGPGWHITGIVLCLHSLWQIVCRQSHFFHYEHPAVIVLEARGWPRCFFCAQLLSMKNRRIAMIARHRAPPKKTYRPHVLVGARARSQWKRKTYARQIQSWQWVGMALRDQRSNDWAMCKP